MSVTPEVAPHLSSRDLRLPTRFTGDVRYLPHGLAIAKDSDARFEYRYEVEYSSSNENGRLVLLTLGLLFLFGYPTGESTVVANATLTASDLGVVVKTYQATARVVQKRTLYSGDTLSELRVGALEAVRSNIEAQIRLDEDLLAGLAGIPRREPR